MKVEILRIEIQGQATAYSVILGLMLARRLWIALTNLEQLVWNGNKKTATRVQANPCIDC